MEAKPQYGWALIDGEDADKGNRWIEIAKLDYSDDPEGCMGDEIAVVMLRNAKASEAKFPGITKSRLADAHLIVNALNSHDALLEACRIGRNVVKDLAHQLQCAMGKPIDVSEILDVLNAAMDQAKAE